MLGLHLNSGSVILTRTVPRFLSSRPSRGQHTLISVLLTRETAPILFHILLIMIYLHGPKITMHSGSTL